MKLETRYITQITQDLSPIEKTLENISNIQAMSGKVYAGNIEYEYGNIRRQLALARVLNAEGYVTPLAGNSWGYFYYRKDYLGNNREVWQAPVFGTGAGEVVQITNYYPSGLPWVYNAGSGAEVQPYKYNGKEFVEENGLDEYDYGFRGYYAAIGRFTQIDPMAESTYSKTPYAYAGNNFVGEIDFMGLFGSSTGCETFDRFESISKGSSGKQTQDDMIMLDAFDMFYSGDMSASMYFEILGRYFRTQMYGGGGGGIGGSGGVVWNYIVINGQGVVIDIVPNSDMSVYVYDGEAGTYDRSKHNPDKGNIDKVGNMIGEHWNYKYGQKALYAAGTGENQLLAYGNQLITYGGVAVTITAGIIEKYGSDFFYNMQKVSDANGLGLNYSAELGKISKWVKNINLIGWGLAIFDAGCELYNYENNKNWAFDAFVALFCATPFGVVKAVYQPAVEKLVEKAAPAAVQFNNWFNPNTQNNFFQQNW